MATLKFDFSDPETKATVQGWDDGADYTVTMEDSQAGTAVYEEEGTAEAPAEGAPGPAAVKAAMGPPPAPPPTA
jgi:hypothetical protein